MSQSFKALLLTHDGPSLQHSIATLTTDDLPAGDVLVAVEYSSLNYKDALAVTGKGKIVRTFPMVPGVDLAGTVRESSSPAWQPGDRVVLTGWGVGERHWGGYAQLQRVQADWLVPLPDGFDTRAAMAFGTAGFTAMQCVQALVEAGIAPAHGPVLVTGAAGGVGSVAVSILHALGYTVTALVSPGKAELRRDYLTQLGAAQVTGDESWSQPAAPLEKQQWAAAIDTVGSTVLAHALAQTHYGGAVAACGLAGGADLPATVMPFILRGVRLLGIDSVMCPPARRRFVWQRLAETVGTGPLARIVDEIALEDVPQRAEAMLSGRNHGRVVVNLAK